jgi:hypothetical protein
MFALQCYWLDVQEQYSPTSIRRNSIVGRMSLLSSSSSRSKAVRLVEVEALRLKAAVQPLKNDQMATSTTEDHTVSMK